MMKKKGRLEAQEDVRTIVLILAILNACFSRRDHRAYVRLPLEIVWA